MLVIADQLLLTNPTSASKPSAVDSVDVNKHKLWDQLDEVGQHLYIVYQYSKALNHKF